MIIVIDASEIFSSGLLAALNDAGLQATAALQGDLSSFRDEGVAPDAVIIAYEDRRGTMLEAWSETSPIIAVLSTADPGLYRSALRSGAVGAFVRTDPVDRVIDIVRRALGGDAVVPIGVLRELALRSRERAAAAIVLKPIDASILRLLADGATVTTLANALSRSERDCYRLLSGLYRRMGVPGRAQALVRAAEWGVLSSQPDFAEAAVDKGVRKDP